MHILFAIHAKMECIAHLCAFRETIKKLNSNEIAPLLGKVIKLAEGT